MWESSSVHKSSDLQPDVVFVDLPFTTYELGRRFKDAWQYPTSLSPHELNLGFRYMVAAIRAAGYQAAIVYPSRRTVVRTRADVARELLAIDPLIVGFTTYDGSLAELLDFIREVKAAGLTSRVVLGGHLATFSAADILRVAPELVDVVVIGEGEQTIVELIEATRTGAPLDHVRGIAYWDRERIVTTDGRPVNRNLDALPLPLMTTTDDRADAAIPLFVTSSRGCYARCSFCRSSHFGERWRSRDPVAVVDEIERAYDLGIRVFEFVDDNFMGPGRNGRRRATAIANEIIHRGLDIRFHVSCRVNDVDGPTLRALQQAGLFSLSLGVESGVQRVLDTFNKQITLAHTVEALEVLDDIGISTLAYIIFFDPYMTLNEARENVEFLASLRRFPLLRFEDVIFRRLIPINGTDLFARLGDDGLLRGDFITGHHFVFRDERVAVLADTMEGIDLHFERAFQDQRFRAVPGLYVMTKESFEFDYMLNAIDLLQEHTGDRAELEHVLQQLFLDSVTETFGARQAR
jgi:radical SAM superfamily enzyme YgiQ (UPF0313 family)